MATEQPKTSSTTPTDATADLSQRVSETVAPALVPQSTDFERMPRFAPPSQPDELGTLGPYRVIKELGHGGMGAVYLGFDDRLKRKVALKVMLPKYAAMPSAKARFLREARAAASLTHDHIVTIHEADERDGTPYMVMQLLRGLPLDEYLRSMTSIDLPEAIRIGRETALGLAAAHEIGLVHRDIKPGNLWVEAPTGRIKILDFGLAKPTDSDGEDCDLTATGAIVGTPSYMAPEQALGEKAEAAADLFSLGVVLYRLTTGRQPFTGKTAMAILSSVTTDQPQPVRELNPTVPPALESLIHQLLAKQPGDRPRSAKEVAEQLLGIQLGKLVAVPVRAVPLDVFPTVTRVSAGIDPFANIDATEPGEIVHVTSGATGRKPLPRWPWFALGLFALSLVFAVPQIVSIATPKGTLVIETSDDSVEVVVKKAGAVLHDKTKMREIALTVGDDYQIDLVEQKDGLKLSTNKFEITRDGKTVVKVRMERPKEVAKTPNKLTANPDRTAAEKLQALAALTLRLPSGVEVSTQPNASLPAEPFTVTEIRFEYSNTYPTAKLPPDTVQAVLFPAIEELKELRMVVDDYDRAGFRNRDLVQLSTLPSASVLKNLPPLTPEPNVLKCLSKFPQLRAVEVRAAAMSDSDLEALMAALPPTVTQIAFRGLATIGDRGTAALLACPRLQWLLFRDCPAFDKRLAKAVATLPALLRVDVSDTPRRDDWIVELTAAKSLTQLHLSNCGVLASDLETLVALSKLKDLAIRKSKVDRRDVEKFAQSLPGCKITWDGGTIEPTAKVASRFLEAHNLSLDGLQQWAKQLPPGYRPSWVAAQADLAQDRFNAVAVPDSTRWDLQVLTGDTAPAYQKMMTTHRLASSITYRAEPNSNIRLWIKDGQTDWSYRYGNADHINNHLTTARERGAVPSSLVEYGKDGEYELVIGPAVGLKFEWHLDLKAAELEQKVADARAKSWRPHLITAHDRGTGTRYAVVFTENKTQDQWDFTPNLSIAQYDQELLARKAKGQRPRCVCALTADGAVRYTVTWDIGGVP